MAYQGWFHSLLFRQPRRRRALAGCRRTERLDARTLLSAFVVTTPIDLSDAAIGDGIAQTANNETSLRSAVQEANALPGPDTIVLPPGLFELSADTEPLTISDDLTIIGSGSATTTIDGGGATSVFRLTDEATLDLGWLSIRNESRDSIAIEAGTLNEIADVELQTIEQPQDSETPIANLNAPARLDSFSSGPRQSELLKTLFAASAQSDQSRELLLPQRPIITRLNPPLDATLGITNPQPNGAVADRSPGAPVTPRIARTDSSTDSDAEPDTARRRDDVVNSLFQTNAPTSPEAIRPAAAIDIPEELPASTDQPTPAESSDVPVIPEVLDDSQPPVDSHPALPAVLNQSRFDEPLPLFPELDTPAIERDLPVIENAAPLLPDLEAELPVIQINESKPSVRRSGLLPVGLGGLLISVMKYRSQRTGQRRGRSDHVGPSVS